MARSRQAQLRGIPVVSTNSYGLAEANVVPMTRVAEVPIAFDPSLWDSESSAGTAEGRTN